MLGIAIQRLLQSFHIIIVFGMQYPQIYLGCFWIERFYLENGFGGGFKMTPKLRDLIWKMNLGMISKDMKSWLKK